MCLCYSIVSQRRNITAIVKRKMETVVDNAHRSPVTSTRFVNSYLCCLGLKLTVIGLFSLSINLRMFFLVMIILFICGMHSDAVLSVQLRNSMFCFKITTIASNRLSKWGPIHFLTVNYI